MSSLIFTESTSGKRVTVSTQQTFEVQLSENPTTGYRWRLDVDEGVALISTDYAPSQGVGVGGGGLRRFVLRGERPGEFALRATLRREWEPEGSAIERHEFYVTVA